MFKNRKEAGRELAEALLQYHAKPDALILAIPRGGVVVAREVAMQRNLPLDVIVVKKIGFPGHEEFAIGATGLDSYILNEDTVENYNISNEYIQNQIKIKQHEIERRYTLLRGVKPFYTVQNKTIILIDDGLATGATMTMATRIIKKLSPQEVIVAIPVAPPDTVLKLEGLVDTVVCLDQPAHFRAIGQFYEDFAQVSDEEAKRILRQI
jgi:predicted phosphoribosyltransferase